MGALMDYKSDREVLSVIQREIDSSAGWTGTRLAKARRKNLEEYFGNPRGDEREGRSQVSSRIIFEQVEWLLPGLMDVFTSGTEVAKFHPTGPEDEESARQATDACNYIFQQNNGFMALYTMFKDALIQKNGIMKVYWEESAAGFQEEYADKSLEELEMLEQDPLFDIQEVSVFAMMDGNKVEVSEEDMEGVPPEVLMFTVAGVRVPDRGKVCIENVAPENFLINRDATGLHDDSARFVAQKIKASVSQLIAWGFDPSVVSDLPPAGSTSPTNTDAIIRSSQDDASPFQNSARKDSERVVQIMECYTLFDRDGDGISEWWRVVAGGDYAQTILSIDAVDGHPFASVTPIPVPHRFYGLSLADAVSDLQNLYTTLWRQYLDSLYLANDPRMVILSQGQGEAAMPLANLDQLMSSTPGGFVEEYTPNAIRPMMTSNNSQTMLPALEMHSHLVQNRTGITPESMGINPEAISKHAFGAMAQQSVGAQRLTLYARIFAETGVKHIFNLIYKTLLQHSTKEFMIQLRGKWVPINPSDWSTNMDCTVSVGLGHGSRMEKVSNLQTIASLQEKLLTAGLYNMVSQDNLYQTAALTAESLGFKDPSRFFTDPSTVPPPEPKEDPAEKAIEAQQEIEVMRLELDRQKMEVDRFKAMMAAKKIELDHEVDVNKLRLDGAKMEMDDPSFTLAAGVKSEGKPGSPNGQA